MTHKKLSIGLMIIMVSSAVIFAQGSDEKPSQNSRNRQENVPMARQGSKQGAPRMGENGIAGEIENLNKTAKTFNIEVKNNATITVSIDDDTKLVYADDAQDLLDNTESRGRQRDFRDSIDTEGMTDEEIRQAMFDANEERIAEMEKAIEAIAIDFSELEEGDKVRVQMSPSGDNVARLIIIQ